VSAPAAVVARGLSKSYRKWGRTRAFGTLKSALLGRGFSAALAPSEVVQALSDVSFAVARGETFGVVGPNGCGKSTLLKLVAGLFKPTAGTLEVTGKVSALIELGAGFHPEISGRENVVINGVMLGLTRREIEKKLPEIVAFSGLEEFIDEPVKTYSSGMYVRLGFAVAVHVDPDVLVVDEVLAVGDEAFAHRCLDTIADFSRRGKTIFFVSHSLALVEELCDRVLYLDHGKAKALGDPRETLAKYRMDVAAEEGVRLAREHKEEEKIFLEGEEGKKTEEKISLEGEEGRAPAAEQSVEAAARPAETHSFEEIPPSPSPVPVEKPRRWGSREVEITGCRMLDASGAERYAFRSGESVTFEIAVTPRAPLSDFVFGIGIFTPEDVCVHGTNTELDGLLPSELSGPAIARVTLPALDLGTGTYLVDVAVHSRREAPYDYWRGACRFQVDAPDRSAGVWHAARSWSFSGPLSLKNTRDGK
jgi:ABC-type polysaccharide/polyol phosphate transport system ATPase subunit